MSSKTIYTPYTYIVYHKPTRKFYYGSRTANGCSPDDLWSHYFTSSSIVKALIKEHGADSFVVRVHKTFTNRKECLEYEYEILQHFKAGTNDRFLNKNHGYSACCIWTDEQRKKASKSHRGKPLSESHKQSISKGNTGKLKGKSQSIEHKKKAAAARTGLRRSNEDKLKFVQINRGKAPIFTYVKKDVVFKGTQAEWAEKFNLNRNSAATTFCNNRSYKGWSRL